MEEFGLMLRFAISFVISQLSMMDGKVSNFLMPSFSFIIKELEELSKSCNSCGCRQRTMKQLSGQTINFKLSIITSNIYYQISREKFKPEPGYELRTSEFLAWHSTT